MLTSRPSHVTIGSFSRGCARHAASALRPPRACTLSSRALTPLPATNLALPIRFLDWQPHTLFRTTDHHLYQERLKCRKTHASAAAVGRLAEIEADGGADARAVSISEARAGRWQDKTRRGQAKSVQFKLG
eukprot:1400629-Pleurochrysis_carterae.AAC.2